MARRANRDDDRDSGGAGTLRASRFGIGVMKHTHMHVPCPRR
jgi:hypothetical protein